MKTPLTVKSELSNKIKNARIDLDQKSVTLTLKIITEIIKIDSLAHKKSHRDIDLDFEKCCCYI